MESADVLVATPLPVPVQPLPSPMPLADVKSAPFCPWGKVKACEAVSFNEVMSEQLATSLVEEEEKLATTEEKLAIPDKPVVVDDLVGCVDVTDCSDDFLLAKMLQLEYDKEHDKILEREESIFNRDSKVKISYGKYRRLPSELSISSEDEDEKDEFLEQSEKNHWRNLEQAEKAFQAVGKSGVCRQGNVTTTKHDLAVSGRKNVVKLMEVSPSISTGDTGLFDMKISNSVFNTLRMHSVAEHKRNAKLHEKKEKSTAEKALDEKTHLILYKLLNNQTLESLSGCISTGKEACVFHAWSALPEEESPSPEFAIKVFKTTLNEFQNRDEYISGDYRFHNRFSKQNPRRIIHMWAEKEMRNLMRMKAANIACPEVVTLKKHVLVMSFIGKNMLAAPKIRDVDLPFEDMTIMYEQTVQILKTLYTECKLVHADFSEYNLLWHDDKVWVIDVSQGVEITHPKALDFLLRDCTNVSSFFKKKGVLKVKIPEDLFFQVCGKYPEKPM